MRKIIRIAICSLLGLSGVTHADNATIKKPWTIEATFGLADYTHAYQHDGQSTMGRMSIGHLLLVKPSWQSGFEIGIQTGNTMRLDLPKDAIDILGGMPIQASMKPLLDLMLNVKAEPLAYFPMVVWLKSGVAWRNLQLDRTSVPDLNEFSPEIQLGFGYRINKQAAVNMGYQYILGKKPELTVDPFMATGVLHNIPSQQAVTIGFSFNF